MSRDHARLQWAAQLSPVLRWVGSKRWAAERLAALIALRLKPQTGVYYEPFLGAGAVALALPFQTPMILSDLCPALAGLWIWIKRDPGALHRCLQQNWRNDEVTYYAIRDVFNEDHYSATDPLPSARMLWLNAAGFNGLYRENKSGQYNTPFGHRKTISLPTLEELTAISAHLQRTTIEVADFADALQDVQPGDVIYCDPPYDVDSEDPSVTTPTFVAYTKSGFAAAEQADLARVLTAQRTAGAFVITTNADTPLVRELYPSRYWLLEMIEEPRRVAADPKKRVSASCLIITSR